MNQPRPWRTIWISDIHLGTRDLGRGPRGAARGGRRLKKKILILHASVGAGHTRAAQAVAAALALESPATNGARADRRAAPPRTDHGAASPPSSRRLRCARTPAAARVEKALAAAEAPFLINPWIVPGLPA